MPSNSHSYLLRRRGAAVRRGTMAVLIISVIALAPYMAWARPASHVPIIASSTMSVLLGSDPTDLDPASNLDNIGALIERNIDGPLITAVGTSLDSFQPALATSWSANADQSIYTFHLRHGVRFHTGRCCLTAADVKYSITRTIAANLATSYLFSRFITNPLKQIRVLDPYRIEFDLGRHQDFFLAAIASQYVGHILDAQALKAHATKSDPWAHNWVTDHDAGAGPYMLQSWERGQQLVLSRFPDYWGGWTSRHPFHTIVVRVVPDATTRRELMERGQGDLTYDLTPQDYDALKRNPRVTVAVNYGATVDYAVMTQAGPLASPYARQALSYAFPYDALIHGIFRGYARRAYGPLASTLLGYDPHMFHYQTDLNKARALLQKAGVTPGTVLTFAFFGSLGKAAPLLQAQLAQLGLVVKIEQLSAPAFNAIFYGTEAANKRPNLMGYSWYPDYNDPYDECLPFLASSSAGANGGNGGYYHNKRVDALLAAMENADRQTLIRDAYALQDITGRLDPPAIWTEEPADVVVLARGLHGYVFNSLLARTYDFYNFW